MAKHSTASDQQLPLLIQTTLPRLEQLRAFVRDHARNVPGVYLMRDARGNVLYAGKSVKLRTRVLSYFRLPFPDNRHARMLREAATIEFIETANEFEALIREVRTIRSHMPKYNLKSARPLHKWWMITINGGVAPRLRVQRASTVSRMKDDCTVLGPFSHRRPLVEALRVLNDALGLRDCSDKVSMFMRDAKELFDDTEYPSLARTPRCHRYETKRCLGPCVAGCSSGQYLEQIKRARSVLVGGDNEPRRALVREMTAASADLAYERAGWLRSRLASLEQLDEMLSTVRGSLVRPPFLYHVKGDRQDRVYLIRNGVVAGEANREDSCAVAVLLEQCKPTIPHSAISPHSVDEMFTVAQFIRQHPEGVRSSM